MKKYFQKFWPIGVIVGLWVIFSAPFLFKGLVPFPSDYLVTFFPPWSSQYGMPVKNNAMPDIITQIYPWKKLTIDTWKSGAVPLWNPYSFSGTPHAGNYQSAVFSPFNFLFFIMPFVMAWSVFILLQPLLAGLFMYLFVRSLDRSREASLLSAIAFMFCGFMVVWMAYGTLGYAALFLPFIFWGIHKNKKSAVAVGIALSLLSGHFQTSLYVLAAAVFYLLWKKKYKMLLYVTVGLCIAAPQLLLGFRSFAASTRGLSVLRGDIIPWQYLLTFLSPDFFGNPVTRNDWFGHYAEWAGFIGVVPFMLALVAALHKRSGEVWFFIILALVSILFALPTPLNNLLYVLHVPVLSGSAASRIIVLVSFALAVLSAFGMDTLKEKISLHWFSITSVCFIGIIWVVLLGIKPWSADKLSIAVHNFVLPSVFIVLTCAAFMVRKKFVLYILIGLAAFDLFRFATKWMPFEPGTYIYPQVKSLTYLQTHVGADRVFGNIGAGEVGDYFRIPLVEGYDAVYQARYGEFINAVSRGFVVPGGRSVVQFDKNSLYKTEALQLLGIKYIYHSLSDGMNVWVFPYWEYLADGSMHQVYSDEKYEIFQYNNAFPRAYLASSYKIAVSDKDIIDTLFAGAFDRRNTLVLEEKADTRPQPGTGSAQIRTYTPNRVVIETKSESPKLLFLSDVYDSGWKATVDGGTVKIYRADYDFRAVSVPSGRHTVVFSYEPAEFRWGIILTGIGVIVLFLNL